MHSDVAIIIPSRIGSTRLPNKPLKIIGDIPMIAHVLKNVMLTGLDNIYVATDSDYISDIVNDYGGIAIQTSETCFSGTDRVYEAFNKIQDNSQIKYILNVQGDMPFVDPETILSVIATLKKTDFSIITPVVKVNAEEDIVFVKNSVKVVVDNRDKALYFSRNMIPYGAKEFLYHIGIYGFSKKALKDFISFPKSFLESIENLEQLRALENNMSIGICYSKTIPISVDTQSDLEMAIDFYTRHYKK